MRTHTRLRKSAPVNLLIVLALALATGACRGDRAGDARQANAANATAGSAASASAEANSPATSDPAKLDAEIERLEKQAGRNPSDASVQEALAQVYVRRANALRDGGRFREALNDYQRAQRINPDNEEAQKNAAEISPQVEGTPTGEYGEPAPLPITPSVTSGGEEPSPQASPRTSPGAATPPGRRNQRP